MSAHICYIDFIKLWTLAVLFIIGAIIGAEKHGLVYILTVGIKYSYINMDTFVLAFEHEGNYFKGFQEGLNFFAVETFSVQHTS